MPPTDPIQEKSAPPDAEHSGVSHEEPVPISEDDSRAAGVKMLRLIVLAGVLLAVILTVQLTPLRSWVTNLTQWKNLIDSWGVWGHGIFGAAIVGLVAAGVPRIPLAGVAGVLLGFAEGFPLAQFATVLGSYAGFLLVRASGSRLPENLPRKVEALRDILAHPSVGGVFFARLLPLPAVLQNALLAMSPATHRAFLTGTFLGYLPTNLAVTLMGSAVGKENAAQSVTQIITAVCLLGVVAALFLKRRQKKKR